MDIQANRATILGSTTPPRHRLLGAFAAFLRSGFRTLLLASRHCLNQRHLFALAGIVIAASFIRLWNLGGIGLRGDEAVYAGQAAVIAGDDEMKRYFILISRGNSNFLLYQHLLSIFYRVFGVSDVLARAVSASFSILTVLVVFELGRTLYDRRVGLIAALLLTISSYATLLGRLAFLDSPMTFFFVLSMLCMAKWSRSQNPVWLCALAAASAFAVQAKIAAVLILPISLMYLLFTRQYRRLRIRSVLVSAGVFLTFLTPALIQVAQNRAQFAQFLSEGSGRVSDVPWHYYLSLLISHEGYLIPLIWLAGIAAAIVRRKSGDILAIVWIATVAAFFHANPLKGFNYLLPIVPALCLLAARALSSGWHAMGLKGASAGVVLALLVGGSAFPLNKVLHNDTYVGLREAGSWLKANTGPGEGVLTMSRGSAQYAIAFYGNRDAYPFGRFRLSTVLPGGEVVNPQPTSHGTSLDWVLFWPPRLIQNRTVSYLVFYTDAGDDPPEDPIVETGTQIQFRQLIEDYGGRLVYTAYHKHEPRVWIYKVGKLLPKPRIRFSADASQMKVAGEGFLTDSHVTIYYHAAPMKLYPTDQRGSFSVAVPLPEHVQPSYFLTVVDEAGNDASSTGEHIWGAR